MTPRLPTQYHHPRVPRSRARTRSSPTCERSAASRRRGGPFAGSGRATWDRRGEVTSGNPPSFDAPERPPPNARLPARPAPPQPRPQDPGRSHRPSALRTGSDRAERDACHHRSSQAPDDPVHFVRAPPARSRPARDPRPDGRPSRASRTPPPGRAARTRPPRVGTTRACRRTCRRRRTAAPPPHAADARRTEHPREQDRPWYPTTRIVTARMTWIAASDFAAPPSDSSTAVAGGEARVVVEEREPRRPLRRRSRARRASRRHRARAGGSTRASCRSRCPVDAGRAARSGPRPRPTASARTRQLGPHRRIDSRPSSPAAPRPDQHENRPDARARSRSRSTTDGLNAGERAPAPRCPATRSETPERQCQQEEPGRANAAARAGTRGPRSRGRGARTRP